MMMEGDSTNRWHGSLTLETSADTIINTLRLPPVRIDTFVGVTLMTIEALRACKATRQLIPE